MTLASGDGWTLHLGDCLEGLSTLADKSVDVVITDPPYEAEAHTLQRRQKGMVTVVGREEYREVLDSPLDFAPITADQRVAVAAEMARIARHCMLVFCQVEAVTLWRDALAAHDMEYRRCIPWHKPDAMPSLHGRWPGQSFEAIVLAVRAGARPCPVGGKAVSYSFSRAHGAAQSHSKGARCPAPHPTTKPLALMRELVSDFTDPNDLVLDPFAGSGSTGVACRQLGRRFLGWELKPEYFEIACRRLRGEEAKPRTQQPSLLDWRAS